MTAYNVTVVIETDGPASLEQAGGVASAGSVVTLDRARGRIVSTLMCRADDPVQACAEVLDTVAARTSGTVVAVEIVTEDEAAQRLVERAVPTREGRSGARTNEHGSRRS